MHQGTQRLPRNTVTVANIPYMQITIRNVGIATGLCFYLSPRGVMEEEQF